MKNNLYIFLFFFEKPNYSMFYIISLLDVSNPFTGGHLRKTLSLDLVGGQHKNPSNV